MPAAPASVVLATAAHEVGTKERGHNVVPYWNMLKPSWQGQPWCAAFVQWCLWRHQMWFDAQYPYSTGSMMRFAKAKGMWIPKGHGSPHPGDLVIYGNAGGAQHVGFYVGPASLGRIETIEGNTSSGVLGSQANGDGVYRRKRTTSWVLGYIRIPYAPEPGHVYKPAPYPGHQHSTFGPNDHHVYQIQKRLQQLHLYAGSLDAKYGPKTEASVRAFQRTKRLSADGFVGPKTWAALNIYS